jgi:hypothetical protein
MTPAADFDFSSTINKVREAQTEQREFNLLNDRQETSVFLTEVTTKGLIPASY